MQNDDLLSRALDEEPRAESDTSAERPEENAHTTSFIASTAGGACAPGTAPSIFGIISFGMIMRVVGSGLPGARGGANTMKTM